MLLALIILYSVLFIVVTVVGAAWVGAWIVSDNDRLSNDSNED